MQTDFGSNASQAAALREHEVNSPARRHVFDEAIGGEGRPQSWQLSGSKRDGVHASKSADGLGASRRLSGATKGDDTKRGWTLAGGVHLNAWYTGAQDEPGMGVFSVKATAASAVGASKTQTTHEQERSSTEGRFQDVDYGLSDFMDDAFTRQLGFDETQESYDGGIDKQVTAESKASGSLSGKAFLESHRLMAADQVPEVLGQIENGDFEATRSALGDALMPLTQGAALATAAAASLDVEKVGVGEMVRVGHAIEASAALGASYREFSASIKGSTGASATREAMRTSEDTVELGLDFEAELKVASEVAMGLGIAAVGHDKTVGWLTGLSARFACDLSTGSGVSAAAAVLACGDAQELEVAIAAYAPQLVWQQTTSEGSEASRNDIRRAGHSVGMNTSAESEERVRTGQEFEAEFSGRHSTAVTVNHDDDTILGSTSTQSMTTGVRDGEASMDFSSSDTVHYIAPGIPKFSEIASMDLSKALKGVFVQSHKTLMRFQMSDEETIECLRRAVETTHWNACARTPESARQWSDVGARIRKASAPPNWLEGAGTPQLALLTERLRILASFVSRSSESDHVMYNLLRRFGQIDGPTGGASEGDLPRGLGTLVAAPNITAQLEEVHHAVDSLPEHLHNFDRLNDTRSGVAAANATLTLIEDVRASLDTATEQSDHRWLVWALSDLEEATTKVRWNKADFLRRRGECLPDGQTSNGASDSDVERLATSQAAIQTIDGLQRVERTALQMKRRFDDQDRLTQLMRDLEAVYAEWIAADKRLSDTGAPTHATPDFTELESVWTKLQHSNPNINDAHEVFPKPYAYWSDR